jgi:hypothetical protein
MVKQPKDVIRSINRRVLVTLTKSAADTGTYFNTRLADYTGGSDIVSLFQFYRIKKVSLKFMLVTQPNNNSSFPTLYIGPSYSVLSGTPATRDEVLQFRNVQTHQFGPSNLVKTVTTAPRVLLDSSGSVGGGTERTSPWLSTANNGILHTAFVYWLSRYNSTSDPTHTLDLEISVWLDCKGTK